MQPKVKICGITNPEDALLAAHSGAKYLGLNFFPGSPRYLEPTTAELISKKIKKQMPTCQLVGVFVDAPAEKVSAIAAQCALDILQFHGEESPEYCHQFTLPVWKALRIRDAGSLADRKKFLELAGIVLDTWQPDSWGGTGKTFDWGLLAAVRATIPYLILSGGLNPENVATAIEQLRPDVIDLCSGVERADDPRKKDLTKINKLFENIQRIKI